MKQKSPEIQVLNPLKAIRQMCLSCSGGPKAVRECPSGNCPLHAFRLGVNPYRKAIYLSEAQKQERSLRLKRRTK